MCGIVGICQLRDTVDPSIVCGMRDTLSHRGPDDSGLWASPDGRAVFGHRRLAIIDLSPNGRQPMRDGTGECHVVFNGEIYNYQALRDELSKAGHQFRTDSDTEVLLEAYRAWGTACVDRLNGMFAFALYDARRGVVFAARDRAGEKPLFYRQTDGGFVFASELKALFADPRARRVVDREALEFYLAYGYVPHDRCIIDDVRKLPAAHALVYDLNAGRVNRWQYWSLPQPAVSTAGDERDDGDLVDTLQDLLLDSVRLRLIADVPVGILLSGGIDSSLVAAMAARVKPGVKAFTISFPGHRAFDEAPYARQVAAHLGLEHLVRPVEPASVELLPVLARQFDEPLADSSMVPSFVVSRMIRREATVALGGDGGDELFGGYPHHSWIQSQERWRERVPAAVRRAARPLVAATLPPGTRGRNYVLGLTGDRSHAVAQFNQLFDEGWRAALLDRPRRPSDLVADFKARLESADTSAIRQATATDFRTYLVDDILVKVDRASMLASLEVRAPWLDHRLIEFAFRDVPDALRATASERKVLPRRLARRVLPPGLDLSRKQGFSLPLDAWFKGEWGAFVRDVLTDPGQRLFRRDVIETLLRGQQRGRMNTHRLFALSMFELWRREYGVTLP